MELPRRLLDVHDDSVKLHETTNEDPNVRFACLSVRWGSGATGMICTMTGNVTFYKEEIQWEQPPRTFKDAITITRKLGLEFIWIDSLAIIQDDPQDWQEQSADMATIYQNAYIALSATASDNADGGCFTSESSRNIHTCGVPLAVLRYADGIERQIFARCTFDHKEERFPSLQRGWVRF